MYFYVTLIKVADDLTAEEKKELDDNCTFVKNNLWIYEGDEDFLDVRFEILCDGTVGSLGGLSQEELVEVCKGAFVFDESLLN